MALFRKPNIKKSIKAKTTGKLKRDVKKAVNPLYGKKGTGFAKDPKRSVKNKVYHATTIGVSDVVKGSSSKKSNDSKKVNKIEKSENIEKELNVLCKEIRLAYEDGRFNDCVENADKYVKLADTHGMLVDSEVFDYFLFSCIDGGADADTILSYYDEIIDYYKENDNEGWSNGFLESKNKYIKSLE